jgi:hypothetical protein
MPTTKRQAIIDTIVDRMEGIKISNGFETNLGNKVEDWQVNWDESDLPALSVCDLTEETDDSQFGEHVYLHRLPVQLRIFTASDTRAPDVRLMIADVLQALRDDLKFGGLALATELKRSGFILPNDAFQIAGAAVEIEIEYITERFNSYE